MTPVSGVILALAEEGNALLGRAGWTRQEGRAVKRVTAASGAALLAVVSGPGTGRAQAAARWAVERGATALAVAGVAGGADPSLRAGELVVADGVLDAGSAVPGEAWAADRAASRSLCDALAAAGLKSRRGMVMTVPRPLLTPAEKHAAHRDGAVLAVDMETAGVARVASEAGIPLLVLRAVCDTATQEIPPELAAGVGEDGVLRPAYLARAVAGRPALALSAIRLGRSWSAALSALRRVRRAKLLPLLLARLAAR